MPLIKSGSDKARTQNALEMIKAGHPRAQAWAAAYSNQRKVNAVKHGGRHGKKS